MQSRQRKRLDAVVLGALILVCAIVFTYSPLHYNFLYPTGGDDTAYHILNLTLLTTDLGYIRNLYYYGVALLLPFTWLGFSPVTTFSIFNIAVLLGAAATIWIVIRRWFGLVSATLASMIAIFVTWGIWYYYNDGTIFNIFNLWVVGMLALYCLCRWLEEGKRRWLVSSGLLFVAASLIHDLTYLYLLASIPIFLAGYLLYALKTKNREQAKRIWVMGAVFAVSILTAGLTWVPKVLPYFAHASVASVTQGAPSMTKAISFTLWISHYLNPVIPYLMALALLLTLATWSSKNKTQTYLKIFNSLNQPISYFLLIFMAITGLGTFFKIGYDSDRFARDLATTVGISTAIFLSIALVHSSNKIRYLAIVVVFVALLNNHQPLDKFLTDYSAFRPCDAQAVEFLNSLSASQINVQVTPNVAPWIYDIYTSGKVTYDRVFNLDNYLEADYVVYRNNYMTYSTTADRPLDSPLITEAMLSSTPNLESVAVFTSGSDETIIYRVTH